MMDNRLKKWIQSICKQSDNGGKSVVERTPLPKTIIGIMYAMLVRIIRFILDLFISLKGILYYFQ